MRDFLFSIMFRVYILFSEGSCRYNIGQTNDLVARLHRHNNGYEKSTPPYKPWTLVCYLRKNTRSEAIALERKLKNLNTQDLKKFIVKYSND